MAGQPHNDSAEIGIRVKAGILLRRAIIDDARAITAVFDAAVRAGWTYLGNLVDEPMFSLQEWEQTINDHASPNLLLVAVNESNLIVGFTAVHPEEGEMFLLFVHSDQTGRGIGRLLLTAADAALRAAGCREAILFTHEQNKRALVIYQAAGYRPDGSVRESSFRGTALRELRLVKRL